MAAVPKSPTTTKKTWYHMTEEIINYSAAKISKLEE
jgi:hypothetical protein